MKFKKKLIKKILKNKAPLKLSKNDKTYIKNHAYKIIQ